MREKLDRYEALLHKWQNSINLVSQSTLDQARQRHFEDSLQLLDHIPATARILADIGSGAGFPGLVLAIARPDLEVHLIESDARKCAFLQTVSRETGSCVHIHNARAETILPELSPDLIIARAFAPLRDICDLITKCYAVPPSLLLLKGGNAQAEVKEAQARFTFSHETHPSRTGEGKILKITF